MVVLYLLACPKESFVSSRDSYLQKKKKKPSFRVPSAKDIVVKFDLYVSFLYLDTSELNTY